jgi:hypothetical protein
VPVARAEAMRRVFWNGRSAVNDATIEDPAADQMISMRFSEYLDLKVRAEALKLARQLCEEQACDGGLWFIAEYITEAYLQSALRKLQHIIESAP